MVSSYYPVKTLKVESDFRPVICLFLLLWVIEPAALGGQPRQIRYADHHEDISDFYFSLLRGIAAMARLFLFYRRGGVKNLITRFW
jgi:hypothetical protein